MLLNKVRVIRFVIGGLFGGKLEFIIELVVVVLLKMIRRLVKMVFIRKEFMILIRICYGFFVKLKIGVNKDGEVIV